MILVIAELTIPLMAVYTLRAIMNGETEKKYLDKSLLYSLLITGGICLIFFIAPGISNLSGSVDNILLKEGYSDWVAKLKDDRAELLSKDALRSLIFILLTGGAVFFLYTKKLKAQLFYIIISAIILFDLWPVNKRYLNDDYFVSRKEVSSSFIPLEADKLILNDPELYYRVFDLSAGNPFSSSRASYFHKSIGGYHGAKIRRYQDLIDRYISKGNENVLDMLNTKYLIARKSQSGNPVPEKRTTMLGNAWFVSSCKFENNADEELSAIDSLNLSNEIVADLQFKEMISLKNLSRDSTDFIKLSDYAPNKLTYNYQAKTDQLTIFSEIYYPQGWKLYLDGKEIPYFRANYTLRAAISPAGNHKAEFIFKPVSYYMGTKISLAGSIFLLLVSGIYLAIFLKRSQG